MSRDSSLLQRRQELLRRLEQLGPMRKGSVAHRMLPYRKADGSRASRGPYFTYTFKQAGKTKGRHLRDEQEAELYRRQIERFRSFQELSNRLVETGQALADLEAEASRGRKNSRTKSRRSSNAKSSS